LKLGVNMKYRLLDILACPYDKSFPLKLIVFEETTYEERKVELEKEPFCELYCGLRKAMISELGQIDYSCTECIKKEVVTGILICEKCGRWYPIREEIPIMLPDELRNEKEDIEFMKKFRDKFPEKILREGKPFRLTEP